MNFFSHLECAYCAKEYPTNKLINLCPEYSKPLLARNNLLSAKEKLSEDELNKQI